MRSPAVCIVGFKSVWSVRDQHRKSVTCFALGAWSSRHRVQSLGHSVTKLGPGGPREERGLQYLMVIGQTKAGLGPAPSGRDGSLQAHVLSVCGPPGRGPAAVSTVGRKVPGRPCGLRTTLPSMQRGKRGLAALPASRRFRWEFSLTSEPPLIWICSGLL